MNPVVNINSGIAEILCVFQLTGRSVVVVVDETILIGVISKNDLLRAMKGNTPFHEIRAASVCNKDCFIIYENKVPEGIDELLRKRSKAIQDIPIVNSARQFLTLVTTESLLEKVTHWQKSQQYEGSFWQGYINGNLDFFKDHWKTIADARNAAIINEPHFNLGLTKELDNELFNHTKNKTCLEIGSGPLGGLISRMWWSSERIAIEPLFEQYRDMVLATISVDLSDNIDQAFAIGAERYIPELKDKVDGLIICINALNHSPEWPFILGNIALYAKSGAYLYLWTELLHAVKPDVGHYNITPDRKRFINIIEAFGFEIIVENSNELSVHSNYHIQFLARKR